MGRSRPSLLGSIITKSQTHVHHQQHHHLQFWLLEELLVGLPEVWLSSTKAAAASIWSGLNINAFYCGEHGDGPAWQWSVRLREH